MLDVEEAARTAQEAKMAKAREMRKQTDPGDVPAKCSSHPRGVKLKEQAP
jgi:hypothetical protein